MSVWLWKNKKEECMCLLPFLLRPAKLRRQPPPSLNQRSRPQSHAINPSPPPPSFTPFWRTFSHSGYHFRSPVSWRLIRTSTSRNWDRLVHRETQPSLRAINAGEHPARQLPDPVGHSNSLMKRTSLWEKWKIRTAAHHRRALPVFDIGDDRFHLELISNHVSPNRRILPERSPLPLRFPAMSSLFTTVGGDRIKDPMTTGSPSPWRKVNHSLLESISNHSRRLHQRADPPRPTTITVAASAIAGDEILIGNRSGWSNQAFNDHKITSVEEGQLFPTSIQSTTWITLDLHWRLSSIQSWIAAKLNGLIKRYVRLRSGLVHLNLLSSPIGTSRRRAHLLLDTLWGPNHPNFRAFILMWA